MVSTVKVYLHLKDNSVLNLLFPALGGTGAALVEVPPLYGGLAGLGLNAILALGTKKTPKIDKLGDQLRDYAYLYHVERELVR